MLVAVVGRADRELRLAPAEQERGGNAVTGFPLHFHCDRRQCGHALCEARRPGRGLRLVWLRLSGETIMARDVTAHILNSTAPDWQGAMAGLTLRRRQSQTTTQDQAPAGPMDQAARIVGKLKAALDTPGDVTEIPWSSFSQDESTALATELMRCEVQISGNAKTTACHANLHEKLPKKVENAKDAGRPAGQRTTRSHALHRVPATGQFRVAVRSARQSGPKLAGKGHQVLPRAAELASAHGAPGYSRPASTMLWRNRRVACSRGVAEDLLGRAGLDDDAALQEADAVGYLAGEAHLVRGDQHCHALMRQFSDEVEHLRDQFRVERGGDLVEEQ